MPNEFNNGILDFLDSSFTFFDLKLRAAKIKNGYQLRDSLHSLLNFVGSAHLRTSNP